MTTLTARFNPALPAILLPLLFIVMWSSGYVVGKMALPFVGPYTLIFIRFASAALILLAVALVTKAPWPSTRAQFGHLLVVGLLIQALQFGGLYMGLGMGVSAAVSALIVGTMPVFTALGATRFLNEKVSRTEWFGLIGGMAGVALVVFEQLGDTTTASVTAYLCVVLALVGITSGTLYQKKFCSAMDLRTGGCIQLGIAAIVMYFMADHFEGLAVDWTPTMIFASGWLSLVNSIGAISILFILMRKGEASKVAGLFHLIPAVTALMGFVFLGETFSAINGLGFAITAAAVYVCTHAGNKPPARQDCFDSTLEVSIMNNTTQKLAAARPSAAPFNPTPPECSAEWSAECSDNSDERRIGTAFRRTIEALIVVPVLLCLLLLLHGAPDVMPGSTDDQQYGWQLVAMAY